MTDIFSEVEEDVRKERWEQLWKRYGVYVIGVATAVIVGVVGWQAWENYELAGRQEASVRFNTAQNAFDTGALRNSASKPWKAPCTTCTSHLTPLSFNRFA